MTYKFCMLLLIQLFNHCLTWYLIHRLLDQCVFAVICGSVCLCQVLVSVLFIGLVLMLSCICPAAFSVSCH